MSDDIHYSGQAKDIVAKKFDYSAIALAPEVAALYEGVNEYLKTHGDELFVAEKFRESLHGAFTISRENLVLIDMLKLEEFERIIKEQAALRNLALARIDEHDGGITIQWWPREEEQRD